jgi:hypothetical protein
MGINRGRYELFRQQSARWSALPRYWQPREVCFYCAEFVGVRIIADNWQRDGWESAWNKIGDILYELESDAMSPIVDVTRATNRLMKEAA